MKKYLIINLQIAILSVFVLASCQKDDVDNTAPTLSLIKPANEQAVTPGSAINFECDFSDNEALKSYKIDIHFAGDHVHTKKAGRLEDGHPWTFEKSWDFDSGVSAKNIQHAEIVVPDSVMGEEGIVEPILKGVYDFGVFVTDVAGNESHVYIKVDIE
jgi:hypothetical protein